MTKACGIHCMNVKLPEDCPHCLKIQRDEAREAHHKDQWIPYVRVVKGKVHRNGLAVSATQLASALNEQGQEIERLKEYNETLSKAVDSWKAANTKARQQRDEAREAARFLFTEAADDYWKECDGSDAIKDWPWLADDEHKGGGVMKTRQTVEEICTGKVPCIAEGCVECEAKAAEIEHLKYVLSYLGSYDLILQEGGNNDVDRAIRVMNKQRGQIERLTAERDEAREVARQKVVQGGCVLWPIERISHPWLADDEHKGGD